MRAIFKTRTGNLPLGYRSYWPCLGNRPATVWFQLLWLKMLTFTRRETLSFGLFMTCIFCLTCLCNFSDRLAAAAGLPPPASDCPSCIQGTDATPLLDTPFRTWKKASFSQYARCSLDNSTGYYTRCSGENRDEIQVMGYSVRTPTYRYTEWFVMDDTSGKANMNLTVARELYDHVNDPGNDFDWAGEEINLADDVAHSNEVAEGAKIVREGWPAAKPPL